MDKKRFFYYQFPAILYALLIFAVSNISNLSITKLLKWQDKVLHFLEYGLFAFFLLRALANSVTRFWKKNSYRLTLALGVLYALSDELHQNFVLGRTVEFYDFLADVSGVVFALVCIKIYWMKKKPKI